MKEKKEIPSITNLPTTTTALTAVGDKIPNVSNLIKKKKKTIAHSEIENKVTAYHHHDKYITSQTYDKLTSENFSSRLKHKFSMQKWYC